MTENSKNSLFSPQPFKGQIISSNPELVEQVMFLCNPETIGWTNTANMDEAVDMLLSSPPNVVLLDISFMGTRALDTLHLLKGENVYRSVCVVLCINEGELEKYDFDWRTVKADDLLFFPDSAKVLKTRLELVLGRASRSLDTNPLTLLPGNNSIVKFVQGAIDRGADFALAYADLDNFKAFNDKYGFARGDEILMLTGRLISSTVHSPGDTLNFVGHVGGDDFIFCMPPDKIEDACKKIVETFNAVVPSFYDETDRMAGMIISTDRQGTLCTFAIMGISIAVVFNHKGNVRHYGQLAERAAQIKKKAKLQHGSVYIMDSRQYKPEDSANCR